MVAYTHSEYDRNAMMRNSTCGLERRELPGGARQGKGTMELAPEQLSELREESRRRRSPPLKGEDIRILDGSRIPERMKLFTNMRGTAQEVIFRLLETMCSDGRFFYFTGQSFMPPVKCMKWAEKAYVDKAPIWCSADLRDGHQALVIPMSLEQKVEFFKLLVQIGFKEIEVGFPAASETEYTFLRTLIEQN